MIKRGIIRYVLCRAGEGASLITPLLVAMYPDKVKNSSEPPHYAAGRISPVNMNAYGGLRAKVRSEMGAGG